MAERTEFPNDCAGVLIVGAGPTGLALALWLTRLGVRVRIIDKTAAPGTTSRALAVQSRTLEFYDQIGLARAVLDQGHALSAINLWVAGTKRTTVALPAIGADLSPFPDTIIFPQDEHERLLTARLRAAGVEVERRTELVNFDMRADRVSAHLRRGDGVAETCEAAYLAGCDGALSTVRKNLDIGFPGGVYSHLYYVADVDASGATINGELHIALDSTDFLGIFPLKGTGRARLIGTVENAAGDRAALTWNDVDQQVVRSMGIEVRRVNWFSTYHVHHRVADHFRKGRAFLLGDAAHIHSPVGGQGMNTGIGDAVNLAWKLAAQLQARAAPSILDTYEPERISFARRLVRTTDRAFTAATSPGAIARRVRLEVAPPLLALIVRFAAGRRLLFRTISQTAVNYRASGLSEGRAGAVRGGDRLAWVRAEANGGADNFAPLTSLNWQVHVYGNAAPALREACDARGLALLQFPWRPAAARGGLRRDAAYLIRPDGYVALADPEGSGAVLNRYLDSRGLLAPSSSAAVASPASIIAPRAARPIE